MVNRYPHSLVWTPLPIITWFIPLIGHLGISNSEGIIYDFGGSYYIAIDNFTFGRPTKYLKLDPNKVQALDWDEAINSASNGFKQQAHNIFTNNCHHHVTNALNEMKYNGRDDYNQFDVFMMITFQSRYIGISGFLKQWGIFIIIVSIIIVVSLAMS